LCEENQNSQDFHIRQCMMQVLVGPISNNPRAYNYFNFEIEINAKIVVRCTDFKIGRQNRYLERDRASCIKT
jgi:hypothetical protein